MSTQDAAGDALAGPDLIVANAPVLGFRLPTESIRQGARSRPGTMSSPPDLSHPSMRSWLAGLPKGRGRSASFETRIWWSPGGATGAIDKGLAKAGCLPVGTGKRFLVTGAYGPFKDGEVERARQWGVELARTMG